MWGESFYGSLFGECGGVEGASGSRTSAVRIHCVGLASPLPLAVRQAGPRQAWLSHRHREVAPPGAFLSCRRHVPSKGQVLGRVVGWQTSPLAMGRAQGSLRGLKAPVPRSPGGTADVHSMRDPSSAPPPPPTLCSPWGSRQYLWTPPSAHRTGLTLEHSGVELILPFPRHCGHVSPRGTIVTQCPSSKLGVTLHSVPLLPPPYLLHASHGVLRLLYFWWQCREEGDILVSEPWSYPVSDSLRPRAGSEPLLHRHNDSFYRPWSWVTPDPW